MSKRKSIVKKSNHLVNARFDFTVLEIRLFTLMVSQISNSDEDFKTYQIPVKEFVKTFNIKNKNIYRELEKTTDSLIKKIIKIPIEEWGKQKLFKTTLVNSFKFALDGSGFIEATFHPDLKPYLLQLKNRFLMYDMKHVLNISSSNSIRMYELLKAFEWIGKRTFEVEELKEILWVSEKYGGRYYNFKKRIILQAQKDLEKHTDISFSFTEHKIPWSKRVHKITFNISSQKDTSQPKKQEGKKQETLFSTHSGSRKEKTKWRSILSKYKFSKKIVEDIIATKYDDDFIEATLKHCEVYFNSNNIANKEGFILKALQEEYYSDLIKDEEKKVEGKQIEQKQEEYRKGLDNAFQAYLDGEVKIILKWLWEEEINELKKAFLSSLESNSFFKKALKTYGFEHKIIQGKWMVFLREKFLTEEQRDITTFERTRKQ